MLAAGDPQRCGHSFAVERWVEDHDGTVNAAAQEVFSKFLKEEGGEGRDSVSPALFPSVHFW